MNDPQLEGVVLSVGDETFTAWLVDLNDPEREDEEGEIYLDAIPEADRPHVVPGAVFYWDIGPANTIQFVPALKLSAAELAHAQQMAANIRRLFGWDQAEPSSLANRLRDRGFQPADESKPNDVLAGICGTVTLEQ